MSIKIKLKKNNFRVGILFLVLSIFMSKLYFELGLINRIILLFNIGMYLMISGYLLINDSLIRKTGKSLIYPFKIITKIFFKKKFLKNINKLREKNTNKSKIYYSRTYRHLKVNYLRMAIFFIFFVIPSMILFILSYSDISRYIVLMVQNISANYINPDMMEVKSSYFLPFLGDLYYLDIKGFLPTQNISLLHIVITVVLGIIIRFSFRNQMHVRIYLLVVLFIHLTSALYMYFGANMFPYTLSDYSELYMKQQIGIWLSIFSIVTLLSGAINYSGFSKFVFVIAASIYSLIFGIIRYCVFLGIMHNFSLIFMTSFFFSFGPFIDFLYLVWMYSIFMRYITKRFNNKNGVVKWYWA